MADIPETPPPVVGPAAPRKVIPRGLPAAPGVGNILIVKRGDELRAALMARLEPMKKDFPDVERYWVNIITNSEFGHQYKEYTPLTNLVSGWELKEGVKDLIAYKNKMKRLKTLIDHFNPEYDYELTIDEVTELNS